MFQMKYNLFELLSIYSLAHSGYLSARQPLGVFERGMQWITIEFKITMQSSVFTSIIVIHPVFNTQSKSIMYEVTFNNSIYCISIT